MYSPKRRFRLFRHPAWAGGAPFTIGNATLGVDYTITTSGSKTFYNFLATGKTMTVTTSTPVVVDYLALGGGGGGGSTAGGGGGAGGVQQSLLYSLPAGTYNVVIGSGGAGGSSSNGANGGNTSFGSIITATGGNGGIQNTGNGGASADGFSGGSRFISDPTYNGGGGGGSTSVGGSAGLSTGGNGGSGITYNGVQYAGGGGGGGNVAGVGVARGGNGGVFNTSIATSAPNNSGSGGGGGSYGTVSSVGGNGGSGIFILSYDTAPVTPLPTFNTLTLANTGGDDAYVCRYTSAGRINWAARISGANTEIGWSIANDSVGNCYATGYYTNGTITLFNADGTSFGTLANSGSGDAFLVKYNRSGMVQWATRVAGAGDEFGRSVVVDSLGDIYMSGYYTSNPVTFFNANGNTFTTLPFAGGTGADAFLVKYNPSGTGVWATRISGTANDDPSGVYVDGSGNVFITGFYGSSPVTIFNAGGGTFGTLTNSGLLDVFLVKYNSSGTAQWATRLSGGSDEQPGLSIYADASGNAYITGGYGSSPLTIFNAGGGTFGTLSNSGSLDAYVVKYNSSGIAQWATRMSGTGNDFGRNIITDGSGNVYVSGYYATGSMTIFNANGSSFTTLPNGGSVDIFLVKFDSAGTGVWATRMSGGTDEYGNGLYVDGSGSVYIYGPFISNPMTLYNAGGGVFANVSRIVGFDTFLAKYDSAGTGVWVTLINGAGNFNVGVGISGLPDGSIWAVGQYNSNPVTLRSVGF